MQEGQTASRRLFLLSKSNLLGQPRKTHQIENSPKGSDLRILQTKKDQQQIPQKEN